MRRSLAGAVIVAVLAWAVSCKHKDAAPGPLVGPSELGLSISITANPEVLTKDGASQSQIVIVARGPNGKPLGSVAAKVEICTARDTDGDGRADCFDVGRLSVPAIVTAGDGLASLTYTAPSASAPDSVVFIQVSPTHGDFANALPRRITISLMPRGVIIPPVNTPIAAFSVSQASVTAGDAVEFDASASSPGAGDNATIVSYRWNFGDGTTGSGPVATHTYSQPVATL